MQSKINEYTQVLTNTVAVLCLQPFVG